MIVVLCYCTRDQEQTLANLKWWNELGGCHGHKGVIWRDPRTDKEMSDEIRAEFVKCFDDTLTFTAGGMVDGWPEGANYFMRIVSGYLQARRECRYFLWMEPDAIPICPEWVDKIEEEYKRGGKPFMGECVDLGTARPDVPIHMSGIGVYWNPLYEKAGEAYRAHEVAWDIAAKDQIIPNAHFTKLIQHSWQHPKFTSIDELREIRPETVIFHASKDGSLIHLLRQKRGGKPDTVVTIHNEKESVAAHIADSPSPPSFHGPDPFHAALHPGPVDAYYHRDKGIHKMGNGIWILEGEPIISGQILAENRLDIDKLLPKILPYINPGDTVIDIGAFIGDHTVSYAGKAGKVYAFEPNPVAFKCLEHNTEKLGNVICTNVGMSDRYEVVPLSGNQGSTAGAYIGEPMKIADVKLGPLDDFPVKPNLIKIDVEGYEMKVLRGAANTIKHNKPVLVIEINPFALARQGNTPDQIFGWLGAYGYTREILIDYRPQSDWYDIIAFPKKPASETLYNSVGAEPTTRETPSREEIGTSPGAGSPGLMSIDEFNNLSYPDITIPTAIRTLKHYAEMGKDKRNYVKTALRKAGIFPKLG